MYRPPAARGRIKSALFITAEDWSRSDQQEGLFAAGFCFRSRDSKIAGLLPPDPNDLKVLGLSELCHQHVFLTGLCVHRTHDDRFLCSGANTQEDAIDSPAARSWRH